MPAVICPRCGASLPPSAVFCGRCGAQAQVLSEDRATTPSAKRGISRRSTLIGLGLTGLAALGAGLAFWVSRLRTQPVAATPTQQPGGKVIYWGVASSHAANSTVAVAGTPTLFDFVTQQVRQPQFWGRYIGGSYQLAPEEAEFLFAKGCRILLIYNAALPGGDYQRGAADAHQAINAAQALGVPSGVALYADIETHILTSPDWLRGWWETMSASVYANPGGFYCNPSSENAANFNDPYCQAITSPANRNADGSLRFNPLLFSSAPREGCSFDRTSYAPLEPACAPGSAVIWQYALGCFQDIVPPRGLCDMDLANERGYASLWNKSTP